MKKITFLFLMLLSITAFSQVEIVENFDNAPDFGLPAGWTSSLNEFSSPAYNVFGFAQCGGTGKSVITGANTDYGPTPWDFEYILTTPNYPGITNDTDLTVSFSINVFEEDFFFNFPQAPPQQPISDWGSVSMEYSVDGGNNWITAVTLNPSDLTFTDINTCTTIPATNLGALAAGNDFQARFVSTFNNINSNRFQVTVVLDNVSITQVATTAPNCDATLISPANGSVGADLNDTITWQAATGIPTGYSLSIGTTSGGTDILDSATTADTSYSLAGLGLLYSTEYFVTIVPFNSFGDATGCTEESFTTRAAPIEGATCSNPFVVSSFPYVGVGSDTSLYENNINEGPCGGFSGAYIDGYDVFYEITPTTDISINIDLAAISNFGAAIHVFNGCPDVATECTAFIGHDYSTSPPYSLELQNVVLFAGNTYYIVLSSAGFDSTFSYGALLITQNSCINPEFTLTTTEDCANGEFYIDVDVTYLGDATSLTLSDQFEDLETNINSTGVSTGFGPYPSGTTVEITLTNNDDNACSYTDSIFYYCPPSYDDCSGALDLTGAINTDDTCTLVTNATNAGATQSGNNPNTCSFVEEDVWFSFVASSETMILEYLNVTAAIGDFPGNQSTELLDGTCGNFTSLGCFVNTNYVTLNNLTINNTYYLKNTASSPGVAQNFDICLREAPAPPANDDCANATVLTLSTDENCDNLVTGTTVGATPSAENTCNSPTQLWGDVWYEFTATETGLYEFTFNDPSFSFNIVYFIYSGTCGALVEESTNCFNTSAQVQSIAAGETRYVMVRSSDRVPGIEFELCVYQLPPAVSNNDCSTPTVLLESTDANGNNAISGDFANSYPSPEACDIGGNTIWYSFTPSFTGTYNFNLTPTSGFPYYSVFNTDDCSQTSGNYVLNSGCYGSGMLTTELVAGNTYLVSIYSFDTFSNSETFDFVVYPDSSLSVESNSFESFKYYPNPVVNTLTVEAKNNITSVSVFNIVGQQVQVAKPNTMTSVIDMNDLKDGVYFVTITIDGAQKTIKVIKK